MRKVRDYDAELKALGDKAKALKAKKVQQLGELVVSTGAADAFDAETLAGGLLHILQTANADGNKEAWRNAGVAFFRRGRRNAAGSSRDHGQSTGSDQPGVA